MNNVIRIALLLLLTAAVNLYAEAPNLLTYQGRLKEGGQAVSANRAVEILLCDDPAAGDCYTSGSQSVAVVNGLFRSTFTVPVAANFGAGDWYLEIWVAGTKLTPRERLTSSAYSLFSATAAYATNIAAATGSDGVHISSNLYITGGYYGDGSQLMNLPVSGGAVAKAGDTMIGQLTLANSTLTVTGSSGGYGLTVSSNISIAGALYTANGNVGIGTAYPTAPLHTYYPITNNFIQETGGGNGVGHHLKNGNGDMGILYNVNGFSIYDWGHGNARLTVNGTSGNVGMGTLNPVSKFEVAGGSITISGSDANLVVGGNPYRYIYDDSANFRTAFSSNVYIVGFSSAAKYYGDGSALTGISATDATKLPLAGGSMAGDLNMAAHNLYAVSTVTASGAITAGYYQIGGSTVLAVLSGNGNVALGFNAGTSNLGNENSFIGTGAGSANTSGAQNSFVGNGAGIANVSGSQNSFMGFQAGFYNYSGGNNTLFGYQAGLLNQSGSDNTLIGYQAGGAGSGGVNSFSQSTALGYKAGYSLSNISADNIFVGWKAGYGVTTGTGNIVIGITQDAEYPNSNSQLNIGGTLFGNLSAKTIGISMREPQAALDVVSTGTAANVYAQIWRDSIGVVVSSITATGLLNVNSLVATGNVGIGTVLPDQKLTVAGNISQTGNLISSGTGANYFAGYVGMGTMSPEFQLHVAGSGGTIAGLTTSNFSTDAAVYGWANSGATAIKGVSTYATGYAGRFEGDVYIGDATAVTGGKLVVKGTTADSSGSALNATDSGGNSLLNVRNDGNVGIGTHTPSAKLHVAGSILVDSAGTISVPGGSITAPAINFTDETFSKTGIVFGQDAVKLVARGDVSAEFNNTFIYTNHFILGLGGDASIPGYTFRNDTNSGMYSSGADLLGFSTGGAARLTIDATGYVGIGITTPKATLDVSGTVKFAKYLTQAADTGITLAAADFGKTITVNSASVQTVTLPSVSAADIGAQFMVVKLGTGQVTIQAAAGTTIADSSVAGSIYNNAVTPAYATITLRLATATQWMLAGGEGSWITQ